MCDFMNYDKNKCFYCFYNRVVKWKGVWLKKISEWAIEKKTRFSKTANDLWNKSSLMIFYRNRICFSNNDYFCWSKNEYFEKLFFLKRKRGFEKAKHIVITMNIIGGASVWNSLTDGLFQGILTENMFVQKTRSLKIYFFCWSKN